MYSCIVVSVFLSDLCFSLWTYITVLESVHYLLIPLCTLHSIDSDLVSLSFFLAYTMVTPETVTLPISGHGFTPECYLLIVKTCGHFSRPCHCGTYCLSTKNGKPNGINVETEAGFTCLQSNNNSSVPVIASDIKDTLVPSAMSIPDLLTIPLCPNHHHHHQLSDH